MFYYILAPRSSWLLASQGQLNGTSRLRPCKLSLNKMVTHP
jgi:hypothetical protein